MFPVGLTVTIRRLCSLPTLRTPPRGDGWTSSSWTYFDSDGSVAASGTGPTASTETHSVCHRYDTCGTLVIDATAEQYISEMAFQINSDPSVSVTSFYDGTDDGSWKVVSVTECTSPSPTIVATLEPTPKTCLTFKMVDSFGDGLSEAT